ncbi:MAG TPA: cyclic nucleotide-binding domain-containing protein [Solirubrobacteraceae bacterium]|nr:cyclic nucleotide-binding domain-containing protein [Solirubrobacteraceae bacterium]
MATVQRADEEYYELLAHGREPRRVAAGEVIFSQGDAGDGMYVVREGSVSLTDGDRILETVPAPGLFGEMALIEDAPRSLSAVAGTDVVVVEIPTRHFWVLVHDTPYFAQLVMRVMSERLRRRGFPS